MTGDGHRYTPLQRNVRRERVLEGPGLDRLAALEPAPDDCLDQECGDCPGCWERDRLADEKPDGWDGP
jgi:hypothetical protein